MTRTPGSPLNGRAAVVPRALAGLGRDGAKKARRSHEAPAYTVAQRLAMVMLAAVLAGPSVVTAQPNAVAMTPPTCEAYQSARPRGRDFEQLSSLFGLSIYRWEEADFGRYRDFLLACERQLPSVRGEVPSGASDAAVVRVIAQLKEYAGYGQGRPRTKLDSDTPDYTQTFRSMSCDRFTRASIESWAGNGTLGKIEGAPFTVPIEYWNDEVWQALENRFLDCEGQRQSPHASRAIVRSMISAQRDRYYSEIDRAQESGRNAKAVARAQEEQRREFDELEKFRQENQARLATDPCNHVEVRRRMMDAANAMLRTRFGARTLLDLTNGRTNGVEPAPGRSCTFTADWSSGQRSIAVITQRKNSFGDDLIEVRPY